LQFADHRFQLYDASLESAASFAACPIHAQRLTNSSFRSCASLEVVNRYHSL